jgi:hypothetical protein
MPVGAADRGPARTGVVRAGDPAWDGHHDEALALLKEAGAIADASGAHRITRQVEESRARL